MIDEPSSVAGDRDTVTTDGTIARGRAGVSRRVLPIVFTGGIVGGGVIATFLVISAHSLIWPASKAPVEKPGNARTVPEADALRQDQAFKALNGGAAPPGTAGQTPPVVGGQVGLNGQPLPGANGQPVNTYGNPPSGTSSQPQQLTKGQQLALASQRAPIMGFGGGAGSGAGGLFGGGQQNGPQGGFQGQQGDGSGEGGGPISGGQIGPQAPVATDELSSKLQTSKIEVAKATIIGDRNFLVAAGRTIPCTLQTAINSTQAGIVSCVIGQDIYSENGRVIMLDKGTKVLGQYTGGVRQGQARLFVVWTRALTPRGVAIDLGSPASDELGRAGIGGGVDTQFWQRFGAALMFSVLEDAGSIASAHFAGVGTNTTQVPAQTSQTIVQGTQNIQPILKANQGQTVAIQVARDYDFGSVYDVGLKLPRAGQ